MLRSLRMDLRTDRMETQEHLQRILQELREFKLDFRDSMKALADAGVASSSGNFASISSMPRQSSATPPRYQFNAVQNTASQRGSNQRSSLTSVPSATGMFRDGTMMAECGSLPTSQANSLVGSAASQLSQTPESSGQEVRSSPSRRRSAQDAPQYEVGPSPSNTIRSKQSQSKKVGFSARTPSLSRASSEMYGLQSVRSLSTDSLVATANPARGLRVMVQPSLDSWGTQSDWLAATASSRIREMQDVFAQSRHGISASFSEATTQHTVLPDGWPGIIMLRDQVMDYSSTGDSSVQMVMAALEEDRYQSHMVDMDPRSAKSWVRYLVVDPNARCCLVYDMLSLLLLLYDLTVIPAVVAWELPQTAITLTLMWVTLCFWTFDVLLNFFRGYDKGGYLQMDPYAVAMNYLRSYFALDFGIVGADWLSMLLAKLAESSSLGNGELKMLRFAKVGRLLRMLAMMRVFKYVRVFDELVNKHMAVKYYICLKIVSVVTALLWFNHLLACMWYAIGTHGVTDTGVRWPDSLPEFFDKSFAYEYWTSFHWAISQCVLGAIEIPSVSTMERIFTILCMVAGLIIGSTLVSSLSASMVEFQMSSNERGHTLRTLRTFLRHHHVSTAVAYRVQKQVRERLGQKPRLTDRDVPALDLLADTLRATLRTEIFSTRVTSLPIFRLWSQLDNALIRALCSEGVEFIYLRPLDFLIMPGREVHHAFMLDKGVATYSQAALVKNLRLAPSGDEFLEKGTWICEMALWTYWLTVGALQAVELSECVKVSASTVSALLNMSGPAHEITMEYRRLYHKRVAESVPPLAHWPTDLTVSFATFADIVSGMSIDIKASLALHFASHEGIRPWRWAGTASWRRLLEELERRRGVVLLPTNDGPGLERVVLSVAARIENEEGELLVQMGRWQDDEKDAVQPMCQLPSLKQDGSESPQETLQRLLDTRLEIIKNDILVVATSRESSVRNPNTYRRVNTITTVYSFETTGTFDQAWSCKLEDVRFPSAQSVPRKQPSEAVIMGGKTAYILACGPNRRHKMIMTWLHPSELQSLESNPVLLEQVLSSFLAELPIDDFKKYEQEVAVPRSPSPTTPRRSGVLAEAVYLERGVSASSETDNIDEV